MMTGLAWLGGLVLTILGFVVGRAVSESEKVLAEKRRVYEEFLKGCPQPNDAYEFDAFPMGDDFQSAYVAVLFYCAPSVAFAIKRYFDCFLEAADELGPDSPALAPAYLKLSQAHNDVILEMRRDALAWSAFGYRGASRVSGQIGGDLVPKPKK